jgi:hypothetical protein
MQLNEPPQLKRLISLDGYLEPYKPEICRRYKEFCNSLDFINEKVFYP